MSQISKKRIVGSCIWACGIFLLLLYLSFSTKANGATVKGENIENYSSTTLETLIATQEENNYLYAGLFQEGTNTSNLDNKKYAVREPEEGGNYVAKFVPAGVLATKAQVSGALLKSDTETESSIRFITAVDSLAYKEIGFSITRVRDNATIELVKPGTIDNKVFKQLYAVGATDTLGGPLELTPEDSIHGAAKYFKTYTLTKVPNTHFNTDLMVRAYWVTLDGVKVESEDAVKTVNLGRGWVYVNENIAESKELGTKNEPYKTLEQAVQHNTNLDPRVILEHNKELSNTFTVTRNMTLSSEASVTVSRTTDITMFDVGESKKFILTGNLCVDGGTEVSATKPMVLNKGELTINSNVELKNGISTNAANSINSTDKTSGGAVESDGIFTLKGSISNCDSGNDSAISILGGTFNLDGGKITQNNNARGVYICAGRMNMNSGEISNNTTSDDGGGIKIDGADITFSLKGGSISGNTATNDAGGVKVKGKSSFIMDGGDISGNTATKYQGGGVNLVDGSFIMNGGAIQGNKANGSSGAGGGVNLNSINITFTMNNGTIANNEANYGGGINLDKDNTSFIMAGGTITANTSKNSSNGGGGVRLAGKGTRFELTAGTISENNAPTGCGVDLHGENATFTMSGGSISKNVATNDGAGVRLKGNNTKFTMTAGTISENEARTWQGGGVNVANATAVFTMQGGRISKNKATGATNGVGGGVHINAAGAQFILEDGTIDNNEVPNSEQGGCGINSVGGGIIVLKGGTISNNTGKVGSQIRLGTGTTSLKMDGKITIESRSENPGMILYASGVPTIELTDNFNTEGIITISPYTKTPGTEILKGTFGNKVDFLSLVGCAEGLKISPVNGKIVTHVTLNNVDIADYVVATTSGQPTVASNKLINEIENITGNRLQLVATESLTDDQYAIVFGSSGARNSSALYTSYNEGEYLIQSSEKTLYLCAGNDKDEATVSRMFILKCLGYDYVSKMVSTRALENLNFKFTTNFESGKNYETVASRIAKFPTMENYKIVQGGCSDGTYYYYAFQNTTDEGGLCKIIKVDPTDWTIVKTSEGLALDHANAMTYYNGKLLVSMMGDNTFYNLAYVDAENLTLDDRVDIFDFEFWSISYVAEREQFVFGCKGDITKFATMQNNQLIISSTSYTDLGKIAGTENTYLGRQNYSANNNYIYIVAYAATNASGASNDASIRICDWNGQILADVSLGVTDKEIENVILEGNSCYATYLSNGAEVYETIIYRELP